jgi:hypothetical protein
MKTVFYLFLCLFIISCNNESDPAPDIATKVQGEYSYTLVDYSLGSPVRYTVDWTVSRIADNMIRVKHKQTESTENSGVRGSLEYTFENVEINEFGKFTIDETVNWSFGAPTEKSHMVIDVQLLGKDLDVHVEETTLEDNDNVTTRFVLLRQ